MQPVQHRLQGLRPERHGEALRQRPRRHECRLQVSRLRKFIPKVRWSQRRPTKDDVKSDVFPGPVLMNTVLIREVKSPLNPSPR